MNPKCKRAEMITINSPFLLKEKRAISNQTNQKLNIQLPIAHVCYKILRIRQSKSIFIN